MNNRNVLWTALSIAISLTAADANAFDFEISGRMDRAVTAASNGKKSDIGFVDNGADASRFRFVGSETLDNGTQVGLNYEVGLASNTSSRWDIRENAVNNGTALENREAHFWWKGDFGKVSVGKQWTTSSTAITEDHSSTLYIGGGTYYPVYSGGLTFVDDNSNAIARISDLTSLFGVLSRESGVIYASPKQGGWSASAGLYEGQAFDITPRFTTEFDNGGKFSTTLTYLDTRNLRTIEDPVGTRHNNKRYTSYGGSAALSIPSGLNFNAAYIRQDADDENAFGNGNHTADYFFYGIGRNFGNNHLQLSHGLTSDYANRGSKLKKWSLSYSHDLTRDISLYASFHNYRASHVAVADLGAGAEGPAFVSPKPVNQLYLGVRVNFNNLFASSRG